MASLLYGISRWNNAKRHRLRHLDNGQGQPLCGDPRRVFCYERDEGEPTCPKCHRLREIEGQHDRIVR